MSKSVEFGSKARARMQEGLDVLANSVKVTLGPRGRHAAIERPVGPPLITKDGVTVARSISLDDRVMNMGAQLIKYVASATNGMAGDGTTTATVLAQSIYSEGSKMIAAGHNPVLVKRGIDIATEAVVSKLDEISMDIASPETIKHVASISANNDNSLGEMISEAIAAVGNDGLIYVEESPGSTTTVSYTEGMEIERGYISPSFVNRNDKMIVEFDNPYILTFDGIVSMTADLVPLLEKVSESGRPIVVIAKDVRDEALQTLVLNKMRGSLNSCAIRSPGYGDIGSGMLSDVAAYCGSKVITASDGVGLSSADIMCLGSARKVVVNNHSTMIIDGYGNQEDIDSAVESIKSQMNSDFLEQFELASLKDRLSRLTGGVALFKVGGKTETEVREKKDRVEDAINAVKAAIDEGVVPGGGSALLHCLSSIDEKIDSLGLTEEERVGFNIVKKSIQAPFMQIMKNSGVEHYDIYQKIVSSGGFSGYDALRNEFIEDMLSRGIIDPKKVVRSALENASSASGTLLTTEVAVFESDIEKSSGNR